MYLHVADVGRTSSFQTENVFIAAFTYDAELWLRKQIYRYLQVVYCSEFNSVFKTIFDVKILSLQMSDKIIITCIKYKIVWYVIILKAQ